MDKTLNEIIEFTSAFLVDITGNEIFEKYKEKRKIKKILKKDKGNIESFFYSVDDSDVYFLIENFILFTAFKEVSFYSPTDLTLEQEANLWEKFSNYIKSETGDKYVNIKYKKDIIQCINLHNEAINKEILTYKDIIHMKAMQNQSNDINYSFNKIINTLNSETKPQNNDYELNFSVDQLEMIMKSYRFDLNQLRKIEIECIFGFSIVILFMSIIVSLSFFNRYYYIIILLLFFSVVVSFLMFLRYITTQMRLIESKMERKRMKLWDIHYKLYVKQIKNKYKISKKKK